MSGVSFAQHFVGAQIGFTMHVQAADFDGDSDLDIVSAQERGRVHIYENDAGAFGEPTIVDDELNRGSWVSSGDADGDGDLDVFAQGSSIVWYENLDGAGRFGSSNHIADDGPAQIADIDGDGHLDVVTGSNWYRNANGKGEFELSGSVDLRLLPRPLMVDTADLDGDGDSDIVVVREGRSFLSWYENVDGLGEFGPERQIRSSWLRTFSVATGDLDGDSDVDVVSGARGISWHQNVNGHGEFGERQIVDHGSDDPMVQSDSHNVQIADVDGDGDLDIVSGFSESGVLQGVIAWYENVDGKGTFSGRNVLATRLSPRFLDVADVDNDGDSDLVVATTFGSDEVLWFEQLRAEIIAGDANRDFRFDQLDIVDVLQANRYLSPAGASFEEGDWNFDGRFDQQDIVLALQHGQYLQGPYASIGWAATTGAHSSQMKATAKLINVGDELGQF